jgi:hypothetical protein
MSEKTGESSLKRRVDRWLDSDLIGVVASVYTFAVLAISFAVFRIGGPIAGMIVGVALWVPMVLFAIQGRGKAPPPVQVEPPPEGPRHRVLVIANRGLEDPALCAEVCRRSDRTATEALIVAPVVASSPLRELADDVDREQAAAGRRVDDAVAQLEEGGVLARGRVDVASPMDSLLDGLREFPPNEVVMLPGSESGWDGASGLAERVRAEAGLPVTVANESPT